LSSATRAWALVLALAAIVVALDQATKQLAAAEIASGAPVAIGLGFELVDVRNDGVAFGLFGGGQTLVIVVTMAALALVLAYFALDPVRPGLWVGIGLLAGGAIGNLADRLREDSVIDFLDPPAWPAFNLADVAIVIGILVIVVIRIEFGEDDAAASSSP
jgi:signal peptidase II